MMEEGFISPSANIEDLDPEADDMPIVRERQDDVALNCVLSNTLRLRRHQRDPGFSPHRHVITSLRSRFGAMPAPNRVVCVHHSRGAGMAESL